MCQTGLGRRSMKLVTCLSYIQLTGRLYGKGLSMQIFNHLQSRGSLEDQRKKRRKDADEKRDEQQLKRAKNGVKCSRCKEKGHNKSTCKLPPPPPPATATEGNIGANATASAQSTTTATATVTATISNSSTATATASGVTCGNSTAGATAGNAQSAATGVAAPTQSMRSGTTSKPSQKSNKNKGPKRASSSQPTTKKKKASLEKKKGSTSTQPQNT